MLNFILLGLHREIIELILHVFSKALTCILTFCCLENGSNQRSWRKVSTLSKERTHEWFPITHLEKVVAGCKVLSLFHTEKNEFKACIEIVAMSKLKPTTGVLQGARLVPLQFMVYIFTRFRSSSTRLVTKQLKLTPTATLTYEPCQV